MCNIGRLYSWAYLICLKAVTEKANKEVLRTANKETKVVTCSKCGTKVEFDLGRIISTWGMM